MRRANKLDKFVADTFTSARGLINSKLITKKSCPDMETLGTLFDFVFKSTGLCKVYKKLAYIIRLYSVLIIEFLPHAAINLNFRQDLSKLLAPATAQDVLIILIVFQKQEALGLNLDE